MASAPKFDTRDRVRQPCHIQQGRVRYLAHAKGYVMARRPACMPFVVTEKEWLALPLLNGDAS